MKKLTQKFSQLAFEATLLFGLGTIFFVSFHFIRFIKETGFNF
jgi:ABC-type multidrug transport system permease subunit